MSFAKHFFIAVILLLLAGFWVRRTPPEATARIFCAYDKLFVEFEDHSKRWGTMFLDSDGRPVSCKRKSLVEQQRI